MGAGGAFVSRLASSGPNIAFSGSNGFAYPVPEPVGAPDGSGGQIASLTAQDAAEISHVGEQGVAGVLQAVDRGALQGAAALDRGSPRVASRE